MSAKRKTTGSKKTLRREDLHEKPVQGTDRHVGPAPAPRRPDSSGWSPYANLPMIMHVHAAGSTGFTSDDALPSGPFEGIGPRNYARADQDVLDDVCHLLTMHGELDVREVDVHCRNGVIRLEGHVPTRAMRREIEAASESIMGVADVENHLEVRPVTGSET